jgi:hypothetical protein
MDPIVEGGQLIDVDGKCLGFLLSPSEVGNYYDGIRTQWVECMTVADILGNPDFDTLIYQQLWFGENISTSLDKMVLRLACSDLVIRKLPGKVSHNPLYW